MSLQFVWRASFVAYFVLLSWQLLTPTTIVSVGSWDKSIHFAGFIVLTGLALRSAWINSCYALLLMLFAYAALTEVWQHFTPGRRFSVFDWVADSLGILAAWRLNAYFQMRY